MNKSQWMIPLSTLMIIGVSGCNANNSRANLTNSNNPIHHVGYYSNENHPAQNFEMLNDNDGPVTEFLDHTLGDESRLLQEQKRRMLQTRDENGNPKNPTTPLASTDRNFFQRDNRFSTSDMNYHGHLNTQIGNSGTVTDPAFQERMTNKIRARISGMENVRSVRSVSYGDVVTVSVILNDNKRDKQTKQAIKDAVKPFVKGRSVNVLVDEGTFGRDRNMNNEIPQRIP
ncbi:YhcN/YlaJ family sporulation lipoprotein [Bacillus sp. BRMEA1]|uniref:YhcN/YlaJ family sporulation lipoprotein n=1 Tax=Neobacillus endophyticus TaxID=2738405 RepID=UPI00156497BA|nr:YhcN/YlaJ family sporulation lipoprotein [Neobacillus endophyticus]NRD75971.1 YhcN/YlaJ family sporulation lipoprotein [Neobacillus endophyticus]